MDYDKRYIFLGPPGSGKGTQANRIAKNLHLPHIDMGNTIRHAIKTGTDAGLKAKSFVEAGQLVPAKIVIEMAMERLKKDDTKNGFILDGFPRSIEQADALEEYLAEKQFGIRVLNLQVPVEKIVERLGNRILCSHCGAVYNKVTKLPKVEGKCDSCDNALYIRADDNPDTIRNRFKTYEAETAPLIDFYKQRGNLVDVEADGDIDEITEAIMKVVS